MLQDERLANSLKRTQNVRELKVVLDAVFKDRTINEWLEALGTASTLACQSFMQPLGIGNGADLEISVLYLASERSFPICSNLIIHAMIRYNSFKLYYRRRRI